MNIRFPSLRFVLGDYELVCSLCVGFGYGIIKLNLGETKYYNPSLYAILTVLLSGTKAAREEVFMKSIDLPVSAQD